MNDTIKLDNYQENAVNLIKNGQHLFVTGPAGTGKSSVLDSVREYAQSAHRNLAVLAPTGIAAFNVHGVTIHSFLHLSLVPYFPGIRDKNLFSLSNQDVEVVENLDMIIIDEVSMVRCDLLDKIDVVLSHYRKSDLPFGGVQVILMGDLYQLPPVANDKDWNKLSQYYDTPFFFSSRVFQRIQCPMVELLENHRQKGNDKFYKRLCKIREGNLTLRVQSYFKYRIKPKALYRNNILMITTHKDIVNRRNKKLLRKIDSLNQTFDAIIKGKIKRQDYPTDRKLILKVGARVMFTRNDTLSKKYFNGSFGEIMDIYPERKIIVIKLEENNEYVYIEPFTWEKYNYKINKKTKELETYVDATFTQFPVRLGWAITVHKSQGLTLDNVIIDVKDAFASGQVYVALSRCRTIGGIYLTSQLEKNIVFVDDRIKSFMDEKRTESIVKDSTQLSKMDVFRTTGIDLFEHLFDDA